MELPSMVQKSGDTLIVRSVVSGNQLYTDQNSTGPETTNMNTSVNHSNNSGNSNNNGNGSGLMSSGATVTISNSLIMEQFERLKRTQEAAAQHLMQQQELHNHMQQQQQQQQQQNAAMELKEEGLPQCKIKRNYSCSYCTYFTQNPRYHLTHLRDVHGEKIVINKCKLCLYASRHYQKLVRHMKMVHGCTEGVTSGHGQARGKRGMNRDRKRKLEDILAAPTAIKLMNVEAFNAEQIQADLEQKLHRDLDLFKQQQAQHQHQGDQQQHQQKSQQQLSVSAAGAFFAAAYEQQLRAQRELADKDSLKTSHSNYERQVSSPPATTASAITADEVDSPAQQKAYDYTPSSQEGDEPKIQIPPQRPSFELTPSPSGSNSSPPPPGQSTSGNTTPLSVLMPSDEPSNNRLMKCSLCDFTTLYRNNLLEHETEDHCNAKFYRCEKCSYVTHIKARFSKHVKYHSMPMIKCVTCDFRTPYKWNLDRHMKNHGGAGPFRCAACDFTADIKQSLTVHEMNHHVPPVGHAAGMTLARRRNKVGGTDISEDFFSDSAEMLEDHFNNNNMDEYDEMLMTAGPVEAAVYESKRLRYEGDEPTDLSQKGGSSDTSSVHNHTLPKAKKPLPNLIPISKEGDNILNLTTDLATSRSSLSEIASMFFNEKQLSEMLQPMDKSDAVARAVSQLSPTTTINSSSASSKSLLSRKTGSFFDKIKSSSTTNENLICPCGHMAKCLSESIIHRKSCTFLPLSGADDIDLDDEDHDEDGEEGRLEIDFNDDEDCDKQSHSALNLSVTGSTRCQHCRHRCKSSADLLNHLKICSEANSRCGDSVSGESFNGSRSVMGTGSGADNDATSGDNHHPMENRVFVWNKLPRNQQPEGSQNFDAGRQHMHQNQMNSSSTTGGSSLLSSNNDENSYYGVETAPGYGEVTKKMTPEEEAANSSLKKVYKCPHCSFWASTASRFHVHIVGHLNKKPFECSLCSYRSNWRWDITKHIRLKTIRDPSHKNARVLMNDETGRRNYTKYNKYITLMKVTEEDGDPKLMKSGEMTPNQVASLAFINDYNSKQQQQGSASSSGSTPIANILNGVREDITLEPIGTPKTVPTSGGDEGISDNFIRLPLLASMMNAAMAQQQHQKSHIGNGHETATLITPSVTISAVKKPSHATPTFKSSDEIILEVRPDSNEKIYKCRKCNFRHMNRDAVLAHVKVHFPEPIVTATPSPKAAHSSPLQVSVNNSNLYMNKVLAAMCLTQQQPANSANAQLSSLVAAGLLDQASGNSPLSGLALALAGGGKSPLKASQLNAAAANIIEHGEQKAILNDQRHCRLKHAGVINIETLDRAATGDRHTAPIYKPLVNGALSEQTQAIANNNSNSNASNSQYNLTLKALQHQQQQSNSNNNNNNVLIDNNHQQAKLSIALPKTEPGHSLLHSPLAIPATASGPSQDLQAAAVAYLAAAYKAAAAQNNNNPNAATAATIATITSMAEELLLQQQLQKNDQIEITRVSSSSTSGATGTNSQNHQHMNLLNQSHQTTTSVNNSNLAQLLESTSNNANNSGGPSVSNQSNSKSKQQKCPLCPYICDSKSQMNYHISLHKPTQYECHLCTFVCAKKQHLSSHMRTVHQMLPAAQQHQHQVLTGTNSGLNMDFSLALKMAAAAKSQQDSPLAIDLSGMKQNLSSMASPAQRSNTVAASTSNQLQTQQLPPEYQYRLIYYCNKCPARYAQKHNDPLTAKSDLDEHLRQHEPLASSSEDNRKYQCEYCDYRAAHETLIQAHRFVHSSQYQEKCNELYKNCKDDTIFRAPKLMHITATRKQHQHQQHHETIWVVDQDLNEGHPMIKMGGQNSAITSSSQHNAFQVGNSLLKKQLEAKQSPPGPGAIAGGQEELTNKRNSNEDDSNPTDSTMASGLSSELDADHHLDKANEEPVENGAEADGDASVEPKERCQHCPFESSNTAEFKTHIQQHIAVSQQRLAYTCEHCDYTAEEQDQIDEHTRVHFNSMEKLKEVAFFTRYDKLELSMEQRADEDAQKDDDQTQEGESMHIKKEVQSNNNNNNNDEDRINENFKQTSNGPSEDINGDKQSIPSPPPPKCAKIILYKNDGCLTIKKEAQEAQTQQASNTTTSASSSPTNNPTNNSQNISDRLRRRISRQGGASAATAASSTAGQNSNPDDQQSTSHKTILVNAKTGQVISRN
ncbi:uncharacterized protein LOC142227275 isoform X4 [Haematobia irritans]|uniref:uncharacterized protein LOC142227275 isoform X4 n=1 Tax=Haematobia irritans TaxID=7368 RepID=UPI003F4F9484